MHDTIRVNASPNQDLHCSTCRGMLKGRVILMLYPQSTCYWTLRPFVLFQLLPVDQARTRQWHLHLRLQRCHSQVRNACSICTTFWFQYLFWNTGTLTSVLLLLLLFFPSDSLQSVERGDNWFMWRKSTRHFIWNLWLEQAQKMSKVFPALTQKGPFPCSQGNPGTMCFMC